jgi:death-on-curing protein
VGGAPRLVDVCNRLAWLATYAFLAKNGVELDPDDDAAFAFVMRVAAGELDDDAAIAGVLRGFAAG